MTFSYISQLKLGEKMRKAMENMIEPTNQTIVKSLVLD